MPQTRQLQVAPSKPSAAYYSADFHRMLGLNARRLRTRPSLLELLGVADLPLSPPVVELLPPLPLSHSPSSSFSPPSAPASSTPHSTSHTMAPNDRQDAGVGDQVGSVFSVSGPVVVAENMIGCAMYELVSSA